MGLDIRTPLGMIFTAMGLILVGYGLFTRGSVIYASSMGVNLNLIWGAVMLVFGVGMLAAARKRA